MPKRKKKKPVTKPKVVRSSPQLADDLQRQIRFLSNSSWLFDNGCIDEACRFATAIRVLVHDTGPSKSLLFKQMLVKDLQFFDTALPRNARSLGPYHGLAEIELSSNPRWGWFPHVFGIGEIPPTTLIKPFDSWWTTVVLDDNQGVVFTRKDIVLALCNKDGGAHVDPELDDRYERLEKSKDFAYRFGSGNTRIIHRTGAGFATVRQIGYEVMLTIKDRFPDYFSGIYLHSEIRIELGPSAAVIAAIDMYAPDEEA